MRVGKAAYSGWTPAAERQHFRHLETPKLVDKIDKTAEKSASQILTASYFCDCHGSSLQAIRDQYHLDSLKDAALPPVQSLARARGILSGAFPLPSAGRYAAAANLAYHFRFLKKLLVFVL